MQHSRGFLLQYLIRSFCQIRGGGPFCSLSKGKFSFDLVQFSGLQLALFLIFSLKVVKQLLTSGGGAVMILNSIEREFLSRLSFEPWTSPPV
jgi:hypothetical protein